MTVSKTVYHLIVVVLMVEVSKNRLMHVAYPPNPGHLRWFEQLCHPYCCGLGIMVFLKYILLAFAWR
jgi:hypothetical protein